MKRFLVFIGCYYYPAGGWDDFIDSFDTIEEARKCVSEEKYDWHQIIDKDTGDIIERN